MVYANANASEHVTLRFLTHITCMDPTPKKNKGGLP
jgi:hypothetical protein